MTTVEKLADVYVHSECGLKQLLRTVEGDSDSDLVAAEIEVTATSPQQGKIEGRHRLLGAGFSLQSLWFNFELLHVLFVW
jgi:hypothetical protein